MGDDIVADAFVARSDGVVELLARGFLVGAFGGVDVALDRCQDDVQRGRLKRFDEALRKADG